MCGNSQSDQEPESMCQCARNGEHAEGVQAALLAQWPRVLAGGPANLVMFQVACPIYRQFAQFGDLYSARQQPAALVLDRMLR